MNNRKVKETKLQKLSPHVKDILKIIGAGVIISSVFLIPGAVVGIATVMDIAKKIQKEKEEKELEKYSPSRLRQTLRRLEKQKYVQITNMPNNTTKIMLLERGVYKSLVYNLEDMTIQKPEKWDGKWRLIIYDIVKMKKRERDMFRYMLKKLRMLQLQKSVYIYPYRCDQQLEFLREYMSVGDEVLYLTVNTLEHADVYKRYFGLS